MDGDRSEWARQASFEEYRLLLISELERTSRMLNMLSDKVEQFRREDVAQMKTDLAILKLQATIYGAVAGWASTLIMYFILKFVHM